LKRLTAAVAAGALALMPTAGCASIEAALGTPSGSISQASDKALLVAETAFDAASLSVEAAVDAGVLKGPDAAKAAELLQAAQQALLAARAAHDLADAPALAAKLAAFNGLVGQVEALIHKSGGSQ
jgi:hypothetical protein